MRTLRAGEPRTVGDYELVGQLGQGAMGTVYLGKSRSGRLVAVKVIHTGLAGDPGFRQRFRRAVSTARRVGGFWTAAVVDADAEATPPWLATEYVPGPTLREAVLTHGPLPESSVRRLAAGLAEALTAVHAAGLVHRDLKPGNVLLAADGPRMIDFGIAQAADCTALTATGMFLGTPGYLSPEQISGAPVGPASDVFALGAVLTYAAAGHGPFGEGGTDALLYRAVHNDPDLSGLPESLLDPVTGCLRRNPADRLTPAQVLERLGNEPLPGPDWLPEPVRTFVEQRQNTMPKNGGTRQYTESADSPPPGRSAGVRFRTSRAAALAWGCASLAGAAVAGRVSSPSIGPYPLVRLAAFVLLLLLLANGIRLLVRAGPRPGVPGNRHTRPGRAARWQAVRTALVRGGPGADRGRAHQTVAGGLAERRQGRTGSVTWQRFPALSRRPPGVSDRARAAPPATRPRGAGAARRTGLVRARRTRPRPVSH